MPESCSLLAATIESALKHLPLDDRGLLLVENTGNPICPSGFVRREHKRVVISTLSEGNDKITEYPRIFIDADAVVTNKMDFLAHSFFQAVP